MDSGTGQSDRNLSIQDLFLLGMKEPLADMIKPDPVNGPILNVGCGEQRIKDTVGVDLPYNESADRHWDADSGDPMPFNDDTVIGIYSFHFLEHVTDPIWVLKEFQRICRVGADIFIGVPHACSLIAFHDLDHKQFFTEKSLGYAMHNQYYGKHSQTHDWRLRVMQQFIMGIKSDHLMLFAQLKRV